MTRYIVYYSGPSRERRCTGGEQFIRFDQRLCDDRVIFYVNNGTIMRHRDARYLRIEAGESLLHDLHPVSPFIKILPR